MAGPVSKVLRSSLRLISREVVMDSAAKSLLGIRAAPIPLLIRGTAFERLAESFYFLRPYPLLGGRCGSRRPVRRAAAAGF